MGSVNRAARSEAIPSGRFEAYFPRKRISPVVRRSLIALVPVAVFAIAWFGLNSDPMRLDTTPVQARIATTDTTAASKWAANRLGRQLPLLTLSGIGRLKSARCGDRWVEYDYLVGTENYNLTVSFNQAPFTRLSSIKVDGNNLYMARGVGWLQKGMSFYLTGPREDVRVSLACAIIREVDRQSLTIGSSSRASCEPGGMIKG